MQSTHWHAVAHVPSGLQNFTPHVIFIDYRRGQSLLLTIPGPPGDIGCSR